jgi:hypothetical protein
LIEKTYRILNKILRVYVEDESVIPDCFERFECASEEKVDVMFVSDREDDAHCCYGLRYLSGNGAKINNVFFSQKDRKQMLYSCTDDYSELRLQLDQECERDTFSELMAVGFYSYASLRDALLIHASAICVNDKAVVFTAASGVGKTTQAELWRKYRNATVINGDKVFLTKESEKIVAWGSPWNGSSPYAENIGAEAAAIIVLEQAEENSIRKLQGMEMLEKLLPHVFFPNWDANCERAVLGLLDELLARTDVYLLSCRPDEDAIALVEKTVF